MGLPSKDTADKKTAYHPGLPMKVLPPLLGITRDYAAVRKSRLIAGAIEASTETPTRSASPLSPVTSEKETAPQVSPPAAHSGNGFVEPPRSMSSSPGDTTSSPRPGSSPMGHKTPSSPMFYPTALPIPVTGPEPLELTTTASNKTRQTSSNSTSGSVPIFPSLSANVSRIPEGVLQTDGHPRTNGTSAPDTNETVEPKLTRKQNRLIVNLDDTEKPPFPPYTQERLLMRPWLMERLELGDIPAMVWVDKPNNIFQIPWKHGSRREWEHNTDAKLFRMWAQHTGKYRPGHPSSVNDPKTWKANFRCAINSLPDVEEVKEMNVNSKRGPNAYKVYTFLPPKSRKRAKLESKKVTVSKREQEVQKQLLETTTKQKLPQRQPSPPVATPVSAPFQPPPIVAPQANTHIARAIETVMRNVKLEEEQSSYREKLVSEGNATPGVELEYAQKVDAPEPQTTTATTTKPSTITSILSSTRPNIPLTATSAPSSTQASNLRTKITYSESHIPHKKRKIVDINFPASTTVNATGPSNLNSLLDILTSDEKVAKRRKEMSECVATPTEMKQSQSYSEKTVIKDSDINRAVEPAKDVGNIPDTVREITNTNVNNIPTVILDIADSDNNSNGQNTRSEREETPFEQRMNVDVLVRTIPEDSHKFATTDGQQPQNGRQSSKIDHLGRVHKNKEFLQRFLKDNGVRTLIKSKLDELHRTPVYQSVLNGQPYIPASIEGSLAQTNSKACSVV